MRHTEPSILPTCARAGMGVLAWSPLDAGWLSGKYRRGEEAPAGSRMTRGRGGIRSPDDPKTARKLDLVEDLAALAAEAGLPLLQLALAFVLEHPAVSSAIVGPRLPHQLHDSLAAADVILTADVLDRIDELCPPGENITVRDDIFPPNAAMARSARRRVRPTPRATR